MLPEEWLGKRSAAQISGYEISNADPVNTELEAIPSHFDPQDFLHLSGSSLWDHSLSSFDINGARDAQVFVPDIAMDEWALQGVDTALFSSLTKDLANN